MGRKSIKENKNIYQEAREKLDLSRAGASELLEWISADRIEAIENDRLPDPEEVLQMAECYKRPELCNDYCANKCPIGQRYVPQVGIKELPQIALEMLSNLNSLNRNKDTLIEICADGKISENEAEDFNKIKEYLDNMETTIAALRLWMEREETREK